MIVRALLDEALAPLQFQLREAQRRLGELERRPVPAAAPAATVVMTATPAAPSVAYAQPAAAAPAPPLVAAPYAAAMAAPARTVAARPLTAPPPPLLDVEAINRDIPIDIDISPFDGSRRRRRMRILLVLGILIVFGGLFAMLAQSYAPQH